MVRRCILADKPLVVCAGRARHRQQACVAIVDDVLVLGCFATSMAFKIFCGSSHVEDAEALFFLVHLRDKLKYSDLHCKTWDRLFRTNGG